MAVCKIWDISPLIFLNNFEVILAKIEGDFKIDKKTTQIPNHAHPLLLSMHKN